MIELTVRWLPFRAIAMTLWPFLLYLPSVRHNECIQAHEHYHWHDIWHWGVIPWYIVYVAIGWLYMGEWKMHPLERGAYEVQCSCEIARTKAQTESVMNSGTQYL